MESIGPPTRRNFKPYEICLREAIEFLFHLLDGEDPDMEAFSEQFQDFVFVKIDPPFDAIWIQSALTFRDSDMHELDFDGRIKLVSNQFRSSCEYCVSSGYSKSVAMLAPVCLSISGLLVYAYGADFDPDSVDAMMAEIRVLVDSMLAYVSISNVVDGDDEGYSVRLCRPLEELLGLWSGDMRSRSGVMTCTFSSLTEEVKQRISRVECCEVGELAGAVSAQLFLMRMGLSVSEESEIEEVEEEMKTWAIATLTAVKSLDLFVILLQVLIEQEPLTGTLASDVGPLLRKVLYDAMLVDYAFLDLECEDHPSFSHLKSIALMRLIVASEAVELFRQAGEQSKAISCENAFSTSRLSTQLVKLVPSGEGSNKCKRNGSSPKAFLKWFEELEQQGVKIFAEGTAKYSDKGEDSNANDNDAMLCIDKVGEKETENKEEVDKVSSHDPLSADTTQQQHLTDIHSNIGHPLDRDKVFKS